MAHTRKKDGERKDKKNERMREDLKERQESATAKVSTDQKDVQTHKPGSQGDRNQDPTQRQGRQGA